MGLYLPGLLFFLAISLPSGNAMFGNDGVEIRGCTVLTGRCFLGCPPGWQWLAFCRNFMSCCKKLTVHLPPQAEDPWIT
ncbi:defensin beta 136 [Microcebus murinus]|uniref:defensin beta 136 n=1 Tax=Microcebus murinus TaxID=30608 RepID=UPI00098AEAF4|nr:beta-defensin 136 [Microcebus murinus]